MRPLKRFKVARSKERLSNRIGLPLIEEIIIKLKLRDKMDELFPKGGSNRAIKASDYITTLMYMDIDGAVHLEDVNHLHSDEAFQEMLKEMKLPTSDAIGDWLRRVGNKETEKQLWLVIQSILEAVDKPGNILDIDATIIESEKGDAQRTYKGNYGYQPLLGIISENSMVVGSDFREGNISPQSGLVEFIESCRRNYPQQIKILRSDSAAWQKEIVDYCNSQENKLGFTITTDQSTSVMEAVYSIPEDQWTDAVAEDGIKESYQIAQTEYCFGSKKRKVRLVVKRELLKKQIDLFSNYRYWIVATNLSEEEYDNYQIIKLHQGRGSMEKKIGELKHQINLNHLPCGQFNANMLYFTIGLLAYNLLQLLKLIGLPEEYHNKTVRTLRYQLLKLAGKLVYHARYMILQIAAPLKNIELFREAYYKLKLAPLPLRL
ncbi:MAG: IS1380 family transposase [Ignavibacterium sp.]